MSYDLLSDVDSAVIRQFGILNTLISPDDPEHRSFSPNDVENAALHFLCVARSESPERAQRALLPVGFDSRVPMREIYELYSGAITPDAVLAAADGHPWAVFFAHFYVGLYADAVGDREMALEHMRAAVDDDYPRPSSFERTIALVHVARLESGP